MLVHHKPGKSKIFGAHGLNGWYAGPSLNHYCCYQYIITSTDVVRNMDTVQVFPSTIRFPNVTTNTYLRQAATGNLTLLQDLPNIMSSLKYDNKTSNAYIQLAQIIKRATSSPSRVLTSTPTPAPVPTSATVPITMPVPAPIAISTHISTILHHMDMFTLKHAKACMV